MKHVLNLTAKQANDLKFDFLQISFEFSIAMERDGSITVRDERNIITRNMRSMKDLRSMINCAIPDAAPGDEIELVMPSGEKKSFVLPI